MDYAYIIIPLIVLISSQALKLATDTIKGNFTLEHLFISYGGFPSSHTAFAVSIATMVGFTDITSPLFGVAMVFTLLVIRDAVSFRSILGKQAVIINQLMKKNKMTTIEPLYERMGHSLLEVGAGALWGGVLTYLLLLLI